MPMPPAGSASAILGGALEGHHVLHIERYSRIKEDCATGQFIRSRCFIVGGRRWCIEYCPRGKNAAHAEFISIFLFLGQVELPIQAQAKFSLLDQAGKPVPSHTRTTSLCKFSSSSSYGFYDFIKAELLEKSEYLNDDSFKIRCDVIIPEGIRTEDRAVAPALTPVPVPPSDLSRHLGALLEAKDGSDVKFRVAGETFSAHKCVLAARSPVFKAQFFGAMKESADDTAVVSVDDMEAEAFGALLSFLYTDALPDFPHKKQSALNQHLLVAADKYNLDRLKLICEDNLCKHIETGTAATILALAEQHNCQLLKKSCSHFLSSPSALNAVMATDGFEHLARSCPSVMKELISNISSCAPVDAGGEVRRGQASWYATGKQTTYWYQLLVLVVLCSVLYLKGGNALLSCLCFIVASFVAAAIS
jgi:speckle-type POZ protein